MCQLFIQRGFILILNYETTKMVTKSWYLKCSVYIVVLMLLRTCDCKKGVKFKRKVENVQYFSNNLVTTPGKNDSTSIHGNSRGFSSLFGLGKVLNFFPVGGERECQPEGHNVARAGICLNPYDCRQRDGKASGDCAHGLGVCCVFEVSCGAVIQNNLTYFLSPGFPDLWTGAPECTVTIEKAFAGITQLRVDFVHFTIGQPNRTTGECDEDAMILGEGANNFTICGQNHGQHIYYTLPTGSETREAGDLPRMKTTRLSIVMRGSDMPRIWLLRLAQMPLAQAAPHGCLQYFTDNNGTIKTFNYASNGRHLSSQDYKVCIRRNAGQCAMRYSPCDPRSFRIGPTGGSFMDPSVYQPAPSYGPSQPVIVSTTPRATTLAMDDQILDPVNETSPVQMMPIDQNPAADEMEGSGAEPDIAPSIISNRPGSPGRLPRPGKPARPANPGMLARIWSFFPTWLWRQGRSNTKSDHPFTQVRKKRTPRAQRSKLKRSSQVQGKKSSNFMSRSPNHQGLSNRKKRSLKTQNNSKKKFSNNQNDHKKKSLNNQNDPKKKSSNNQSQRSDAQGVSNWKRWGPYAQHYEKAHNNFRYYGYGNFGAGLAGYGRLRCQDRITIPCESEFFVGSSAYGPGVCDPHHCGPTFCPGAEPNLCQVETSIAPFAVTVHFGPPAAKNPEENIGACLRYLQLPCDG